MWKYFGSHRPSFARKWKGIWPGDWSKNKEYEENLYTLEYEKKTYSISKHPPQSKKFRWPDGEKLIKILQETTAAWTSLRKKDKHIHNQANNRWYKVKLSIEEFQTLKELIDILNKKKSKKVNNDW